jgi:hypothetical protein
MPRPLPHLLMGLPSPNPFQTRVQADRAVDTGPMGLPIYRPDGAAIQTPVQARWGCRYRPRYGPRYIDPDTDPDETARGTTDLAAPPPSVCPEREREKLHCPWPWNFHTAHSSPWASIGSLLHVATELVLLLDTRSHAVGTLPRTARAIGTEKPKNRRLAIHSGVDTSVQHLLTALSIAPAAGCLGLFPCTPAGARSRQ